MLAELLRLGVIRTSTEITGAQVLLVAKKGTTIARLILRRWGEKDGLYPTSKR